MAKKSRELFMREKKMKWREIKVNEVTKRERSTVDRRKRKTLKGTDEKAKAKLAVRFRKKKKTRLQALVLPVGLHWGRRPCQEMPWSVDPWAS